MANTSVRAVSSEPLKRGSYAIAGPATRRRILDAAVQCLEEVGYFGTTTLLVQKCAGVSRGSLLNQFPTRADLLVAVSDHIIEARARAFSKSVETAQGDREIYERLVDVQWASLCQPGGLARLEIYVASVSDPELKKRFEANNLRVDANLRKEIWVLAKRLGIRDRAGVSLAVTMFTACLRGLALDLLYPRPGVDVDAAFAEIKRAHIETLDRLIAASQEDR